MNLDFKSDIGVVDALFHRRAVRKYTDKDVSPELVRELIEAAIQAPSAMNQQPWAFAVFHGRRRLRAYSDRAKEYLLTTTPSAIELHSRSQLYASGGFDIFHGATTLIVIYAVRSRLNPTEDCCLAAENLMLAAHAMKLGTCPIGFARPWLDLPETKRELGVPEHLTAVFPIVVGYPAGETPSPGREDPVIVSWKWSDIPDL